MKGINMRAIILLLPGLVCMTCASAGFAQNDNAAFCDAYFREVMRTGTISRLSVAIEQGGQTRYAFAVSDGNPKNAGFTAQTPLPVASITKIFTATLIVKLVEDGNVSLYDNVRRFIPEFPFDDVLLLNLLTHTSGVRNRAGYSQKNKAPFYASLGREFPCDTSFSYFSSGYDVLADVVERAGGMAFQEYGRKIVFSPLKMADTKFSEDGQGGSGMTTTAADLLKFGRHILDIKKTGKPGVLTRFSVELMLREMTCGRYDRTPAFFKKSQSRRFGRYFGDLNSEEAVGHAGATGCFFCIDPEYDLAMVFLSADSNGGWRGSDENFVRVCNVLMGRFAN